MALIGCPDPAQVLVASLIEDLRGAIVFAGEAGVELRRVEAGALANQLDARLS
jgi:hypothetical protein